MYQAVIATNDDAQSCKLSAINAGYFEDQFLNLFVHKPIRRPPLINRGYWSRVSALRKYVDTFLAKTAHLKCGRQIISLGAGFDTLFFQLQASKQHVGDGSFRNEQDSYLEFDLDEVVQRKIDTILKQSTLKQHINPTDDELKSKPRRLRTKHYGICSLDLNDVSSVENALSLLSVSKDLPTLIISECVLIYLKPDKSDNILQFCASYFDKCCFWMYEQVNPNDPFGRMMVENLQKRGCGLESITAYPSVRSQVDRLKRMGWHSVEGATMLDIYNNYLSMSEKLRVDKIEMLDELEEWNLIQSHYSIVFGWHSFFDSLNIAQLTTLPGLVT